MTARAQPVNILTGTDELIDAYLQSAGIQQSYATRTACKLLSGQSAPWQSANLLHILKEMSARIHGNWRKNERQISLENWRWEPKPKFARENTSAEVTLERCIVNAGDDRWTKQVPTSTGLCTAYSDRTRNVDLVLHRGGDDYEFIELKISSNNPIYAAFEIIRNALLFLFTRKLVATTEHLPKGKRNLLCAASVDLVVLAPAEYYARLDFSYFERAMNEAIFAHAADECGLTMSFKFKSFPAGFTWIIPTEMKKEDAETLLAAVENRADVLWGN